MKSAHILLVEDNDGDVLLTVEALEDRKIINKVSVVRNGKDALDFVFKRGQFTKAETPDLILLDVNLPLKNGHEVLQAIKTDKETAQIPIIMLTTSSAESDVRKAYQQHANCYITKPIEVEDFLAAVTSIEEFWFQLVRLPNNAKK